MFFKKGKGLQNKKVEFYQLPKSVPKNASKIAEMPFSRIYLQMHIVANAYLRAEATLKYMCRILTNLNIQKA